MSHDDEIMGIQAFHNPPERFNSHAEMKDFVMQRSAAADELKDGIEHCYAVVNGAPVVRNIQLSHEQREQLKLNRDNSKKWKDNSNQSEQFILYKFIQLQSSFLSILKWKDKFVLTIRDW